MDKIDVIDKMFEKWVIDLNEFEGTRKEIIQQFRSDFIEVVKAVLPKPIPDPHPDQPLHELYGENKDNPREIYQTGKTRCWNFCLDTIIQNLEGMK